MNISLIYPILTEKRNQREEGKQYWPPLGLAYIAACLEGKGHQVRIIDRDIMLRKNRLNVEKTNNETIDKIMEFDSNIVGYSVTTPHVQDAAKLSHKIKILKSNITQVIGGPHCVGAPHATLDYCKDMDILVRGEGEATFLDIASDKAISSVAGTCYRSNGEVKSNRDRDPIVDLDSIPKPARHLLDMDFYMRPNRFASRNLTLRTTSIMTSRGCPYRCNYCAGPLNFPGKVRFHSPARIIDEITELVERYKTECLYFADDMFLSNLRLSGQILQRLIDTGLNKKVKWIAQLHPKAAKPDFLDFMRDAGCVQVEYGFESGSQKVLGLMNKRSDIKDNLKVAELTRKTDIRLRGNFIVGYPGERKEDFEETLSFIKKAKPHQIGFHLLMPLPGTKVHKELSSKGATISWQDMGDDTNLGNNYSDIDEATFKRLYYRTYLATLLPINIYYFVKDNVRNPLRIIYIGFKQLRTLFRTLGRATTGLLQSRIKGRSLDKKANKQNIIMIAPFGLKPFGTVRAEIFPIASVLKRYDVSVVIPPIFDVDQSGRDYMKGDAKIYNIKVFKNFSIWQVPIITLRMIKKITSLKGDIIHVFKPKGMSGFVAMFFILFSRKPVILHTDDLEGKGGWNDLLDYPVWANKIIDFQEKWVAKYVKTVTVPNKYLGEKMLQFGAKAENIYYLPHSIESERLDIRPNGFLIRERYGFGDTPIILLYTRFIECDLRKIIDIARQIKVECDTKILVIGKGPNNEESKLLELAKETELEDIFVFYIGWLPYRELANYIDASDVAIYPFDDIPINRFKAPTKILEIMSVGKPVVADAMGQLREYIVHSESGFLANPSDTREFSSYVIKLLRNKDLRERMGQKARERVLEHFNWNKNIEALEKIYAECGNRGR